MPPVRVKVTLSLLLARRSIVIAPLPRTEGTLNENAWGEPMCGCPSRLKRMRSIALASVAVPTVERGSVPIRCWSTMIAVVSPSSTSTSGRASVGMKPCTKALYVSLISRCDSAAIVSNTSELLPEPETPVNTVSRRFGSSTLTSWRLFTRAPCTRIRSCLSATCMFILSPLPMVIPLRVAGWGCFSIPDRCGHLVRGAEHGWYAVVGGDPAADPLELAPVSCRQARHQAPEPIGYLAVELLDDAFAGRRRGQQYRSPIVPYAFAQHQAAPLDPVDQAAETGAFEAEDAGELGHAAGSVLDDAEQLCLGRAEVMAGPTRPR